jgi:NAD(P)-dependent dehydrogenase (short-subunit alcohol dehydrogenase family)
MTSPARAKSALVIGATGDVGRGIVRALLERGHRVAAAARDPARLDALIAELGRPPGLLAVPGSLESDERAAKMLEDTRAGSAAIHAVIVAVNAPRRPAALFTHSSDSLTALIRGDLITHYTAARTFVPALAPGGVFVGIGGGSCDFILSGGVAQSVAQAALRMLYRGIAHELAALPVHVKELIIASVVNGAGARDHADPSWVTDSEVGRQVAAIVEDPASYPAPVLRIARRDGSGQPVFSSEGPTRIQGFSQP